MTLWDDKHLFTKLLIKVTVIRCAMLTQLHILFIKNTFILSLWISKLFNYIKMFIIITIFTNLKPVWCKKQQKKSSRPVIGFWNRGPLKILNGIELILDDQGNHLDSNTISLESFRYFRGPLFRKPVTGQELFVCCFLQQTDSKENQGFKATFFCGHKA